MNKLNRATKRKIRTRAKVQGTKERPRLSIFRSNKFVYAQLIDDVSSKTIFGVSEKNVEAKDEKAKELGKLVAKKAAEKKIKKVIFDRGSYAYHGKVKAIAEGAREGGLEF